MDSTPLPVEFYLLVLAGVASITVGAFGSTFLPLLTSEDGYDLSSVRFLIFVDGTLRGAFSSFQKIIDRIGNTRLLLVGIFAAGAKMVPDFNCSIFFSSLLLFQALQESTTLWSIIPLQTSSSKNF